MQERPSEGASSEDGVPPVTGSVPQTKSEETFRQELEDLQARADQLLSNWQRAEADFANYRKRVEGEQEERLKVANAVFIANLLNVVDDLDRALSSVAEQLIGFTWVDGIWFIHRKFMAILEAYGVQEIEAADQRFDPLYHQAVQEVEGEEGKVKAVVQKGYTLHQRLLRHALVTVGKRTVETQTGEQAPPSSEASPG